jgi:hypothetical protein
MTDHLQTHSQGVPTTASASEAVKSYVAHIVLKMRHPDGRATVAVEVVVLVEAESYDDAEAKAAGIGESYNGTTCDRSATNDAVATFMGVRKIHEPTRNGQAVQQVRHGDELTSIMLELDTEEDFDALLEGDFVTGAFEW